jgi:DNA-directed RNA polymerase subunit RPC12/RpoP
MNYFCQDCSYRGKTAGPTGDCPACGSYALVRPGRVEDKPPPGKARLVLLVVLWAIFLLLLLWKLIE